MADWIGHLAVGACAGKVFRIRNLHVVLLGSILPDLPPILGTLSDLGWLNADAYTMILVLLPAMSVLAVVCFCLAAAAWLTSPWRAVGLLLAGAGLHIALDVFQMANVLLPGYPVTFRVWNWPLYHYGAGPMGMTLVTLGVLIGLRCLPLERDIHFRWRYGWISLLPLGFLAMVIIGNTARLEEANVLNIRFLKGEAVPEGAPVTLISARVITSVPLVVQKGRRRVEVGGAEPVAKNRIVSLWGYFQGNRVIPFKVLVHSEYRKMVFSMLGGLVLIAYWVKIPWLDSRGTARRAGLTPAGGS